MGAACVCVQLLGLGHLPEHVDQAMEEMHPQLEVTIAAHPAHAHPASPSKSLFKSINQVVPSFSPSSLRSRRPVQRRIPELVDVPALVGYVRALSLDVRPAAPPLLRGL
jgi:hypothetical protein